MSVPRTLAHGALWRAFPWDRNAPDGAPFSIQSVAPAHRQNAGRFDLHGRPLVLYLAETPAHAVSEVLRGVKQDPTNPDHHRIHAADLVGSGHPRALVRARLPESVADRLPDFAEGEVLRRYGVRADHLSASPRSRALSRAAARRIYEHPDQVPGFFWWSAFSGDWHVVLLFLDRVGLDEIEFGEPEILTLDHPAVLEAARALNLEVEGAAPPAERPAQLA